MVTILTVSKRIFVSTLVLICFLPVVSGLQANVADDVCTEENGSMVQEVADLSSSKSSSGQQAIVTSFQGNLAGTFQGIGSQMLQFSSFSDPGSFTRHMMCKDHDLNYNPMEPTTIFRPGDTKAECLMTVLMNKSDTIEWRWYYRNDSSDTWVSCPVPYENRSYVAQFINGPQVVAAYLYISGCWPGVYYPRAYKLEVYYMSTSPLFSEFFEVTNGGLNSPRMCEEVDSNGDPVSVKSRFTVGVDTKAYHFLRFDKIAYFNQILGCCHNFTVAWIQPDGSTYKMYLGSFADYKSADVTWNYWDYNYTSDNYITVDSSTPVGNWTVEVYLDNYYSNTTWVPYGPVASTPFIVGDVAVADWTFMVYLDADVDKEGTESAAIDVFLKMANVSSSPLVNIIVQMDRMPGYDDRFGNWTDCMRFNVTKGTTPTPENSCQNLTEVNMGDPRTLKDFVNWTVNNYPANHFFLTLWDHGAGFMGVCLDSTSEGDCLTLPELSQALSGLPAIMDIVFIDACSMSMVEVAYQIKDFANILIGPEGLGYSPAPYDNYLLNFGSNSSMLPDELATDVVTDYIDWCWSIPVNYIPNATMSATDLTKIVRLAAAIDNFATSLKEKEDAYHEQISLARNLTAGYPGPYANQSGSYMDLYDFAELAYQYVPDGEVQNTSSQLMTALSVGNTIITEGDKADLDARGLAIFFPDEKGKYESFKSTYNSTAFSIGTMWDEFEEYHLTGYVLTIKTPYPNGQVRINEDPYTTDVSGKVQVFVLPRSYTINLTALVSTAPDAYGNFTKWKDGSTSNPRTLDINGDLTVEAEYETYYRLIIDTNFGSTNPSAAEYWYFSGHQFQISASAPNASTGERYEWLGWTGTGPGNYNGSTNTVPVTMNGPINETAAWRHEYCLTVTSLQGYSGKWFEDGASVYESVFSPVSNETGTRYVCVGWNGTGSVPVAGTTTAFTFTMNMPSNVTWNWKTQHLLTVLTDPAGLGLQPVKTPLGEAGPENGWWYDNGTSMNVTAQVIGGYTFNHWSINGANWEVGLNPVTVLMDEPHYAEAHYEYAQTWWGLLTRPDVLQVLLAIVGTVVTVALIGTAWIRNRRGRSIVRAFSDEIDKVYSSHEMDPQKCKEELHELRNTILDRLTDGKISEETYSVLDKKIDKYMAELEKQKKT